MATSRVRGAGGSHLIGRASRHATRFQDLARSDGFAVALTKAVRKIGRRLARACGLPNNSERHGPIVGVEPRRDRSFNLKDLLACPDCTAWKLKLNPNSVRCTNCGAKFEARAGTPFFVELMDSSFSPQAFTFTELNDPSPQPALSRFDRGGLRIGS